MTSYFEIDGVIIECEDEEMLPRIPNPLMGRWEVEEITRGELRDLEVDAKYEKGLAAQGAAGGSSHVDEWGRASIGSMMVRTGAAMLLIPDPLEPVSTPIAAGLVLAGVALHSTTW